MGNIQSNINRILGMAGIFSKIRPSNIKQNSQMNSKVDTDSGADTSQASQADVAKQKSEESMRDAQKEKRNRISIYGSQGEVIHG